MTGPRAKANKVRARVRMELVQGGIAGKGLLAPAAAVGDEADEMVIVDCIGIG